MRTFPFVLTATIAAFVTGAPQSRAAQEPASIPSATAPTAADSDTATRFKTMLHAEAFDELIADATAALANPPAPGDLYYLRYYRGCALWRLGFLDEAQADMTAIAPDQAAHSNLYPAPQWFVETIARQIERRPPHRQEVTVAGVPCFTVFYDENDLALRQLLDLLPVSVNSVRGLTGAPPRRAVILLFGSIEKMQAYEDIPRRTSPIDESVLAHGGYSGVHICLTRKANEYVVDPRGGYFRLSITHEYTHVIVDRILEAHAALPTWLAEGMANVAGFHSAPGEQAGFVARLKSAVDHKALLTLSQLRGRSFYQMSNEQFASKRYEDPYAQATEMVSYLLLGRQETIFADLLQAMRRTDDFPKAFAETFGETVDEFYADWRAYAVR